jgi:type I restriction enzyme S subunit
MAASLLGDNVEIVMGQSPPGETCNTAGVGLPLLNGPTEYGPHHPCPVQFTTDFRKRARQGDLLFCVRGSTTGRMNWADREYAIGRGVAAIRHKRRPDLQPFVRAVVEYGLRGLLAQATGSTFPNLSADQLGELWWPPLGEAEQRAIAQILGALDDKIELNRRASETLESMARAIFKSWFVDFDPVRAKVEGRDPGLRKEFADFFPDRFEDSESREIPAGWSVRPLPDVIDVNPRRSLRKGEVAPYLDMASMPTRGHTPDEVVQRVLGSGVRFLNGDTLVARITPCLENGKTALVDFLHEGQIGWGSTEYIVLRPKPPLPNEYGYCLARSVEFRDFAIQSMTGSSGRQRVPVESLSHFSVAFPSRPVAELFERTVKPLFARAREAAAQGRTLAALRDAMLPELISGRLRIKAHDQP